MRDGEWNRQLLQHTCNRLLIRRVGEGEEGRQRNRFSSATMNLCREPAQLAALRGSQDLTCRVDALGHPESKVARNQWRGALEQQIVELGPGLPSDFNRVFEARGGNECDTCAFALQQSIGADRRSV